MKKWCNLRNAENGRYKLSVIVLSVLLAASLLWQGVFAMLGTTDANADAFAMLEAFGADVGDGLQEQRAAAWLEAVQNPAASGGVWGQFWENAQFGAPVPTPAPTPTPVPTPTPTPTPLPGPTIPQVGDLFVDNNIIWRVLHRQEGAALIITEHVFGHGTRHNSSSARYTRLSNSSLRRALDTWAQDNLGTLRQRMLMPIDVDDDVRENPSTQYPAWVASENGVAGFTSPGERTNSDSAVFVLSMSEANQYFGPPREWGNSAGNREARIARDTSGIARFWWLRSPGSNLTMAPVASVSTSGGLESSLHTSSHNGFRPALWISV